MKIKKENWKVALFKLFLSFFLMDSLSAQFASANEEKVCSVKWSWYANKLSKLISMEARKTMLFAGSDGRIFNCYSIALEKSELEFIEELEKTFASDENEENKLNVGDEVCVIAKYTYEHRLVNYIVRLPYDRKLLESKSCVESVDAAVDYYFGASND